MCVCGDEGAKEAEVTVVLCPLSETDETRTHAAAVATGAELLPRLALPPALEADRRRVHPVGSRGEHAQAQQHRVRHGGVRGGVREAALHARLRLPAALPHGRQLQETAHHARRRQLHLSQQVRAVVKNALKCDEKCNLINYAVSEAGASLLRIYAFVAVKRCCFYTRYSSKV